MEISLKLVFRNDLQGFMGALVERAIIEKLRSIVASSPCGLSVFHGAFRMP